MIKVKKLIELLSHYPEEAEVKWNDGSEIKNLAIQQDNEVLILSDHRAIGYCLKCGSNVYKEEHKELEDYTAYCPTCDENKFSFEIEDKPEAE